MLAGSNPAARTSQSQSPRSPYRGAGRLFCTRFAGSMTSRRHQIMICGSLLPIPPRLSNRYIPPPITLPASRTAFPRRRIGGLYLIRRAATLSGLAGRDATAFLPAFPSRLAARLGFRSPPRFPIRPIGFSSSSSPRFPLGGSVSHPIRFSIRSAGRMRVFRAHIRFPRRFRRGM